jgi:phosphoribosyl-ATP pyrophosphohydrolase/phosphoribosyl-AMP cyclohydrolase
MSGDKEELLNSINWNENGLLPAISQGLDGRVLTLAYMDREALNLTLSTGFGHYFSRSKGRIRKKGEVSGNVQLVEEVKIDCDGDAVLLKVNQKGPACHTGQETCFYRDLGEPEIVEGSLDYSLNILKELEEVIRTRKETPREESYTSKLFRLGLNEINKKLGEEAIETIVSSSKDNLIHEAADLLYHLLVLLRAKDVELEEVMDELGRRRR